LCFIDTSDGKGEKRKVRITGGKPMKKLMEIASGSRPERARPCPLPSKFTQRGKTEVKNYLET